MKKTVKKFQNYLLNVTSLVIVVISQNPEREIRGLLQD